MANFAKKVGSPICDSSSAEDYLEAILVLSSDDNDTCATVRVTDLSTRLGVSKPSVSAAVRKLAHAGYVEHEPYGGVTLTRAGRERATEVPARHALLHRFLVEILGVDEQTAQQDACRIEHDLSDETVKRLTQFVEFLTGADSKHAVWKDAFAKQITLGTLRAD